MANELDELTRAVNASRRQTLLAAPHKKMNQWIVAGLLLPLVIVAIAAVEFVQKRTAREQAAAREMSPAERARYDREADAVQVSKDYVRAFLKHPDDAEFGIWDMPEIRKNPAGTTFYVSSKVKAKNDFGGLLTYRWATIVTWDGITWKLVSCAIDDKIMYDAKNP